VTIEEYNNCVKEHSDGIFRFVLKQIANRADAHDIVQNTFEKLWKNRHKVTFEKSKSYTYTIAYHDMIDWTRRRKFVAAYQNVPEKVERDFQKQYETKELIDKGLSELNDIQQSLILLRDYEGYTYDEIAEITELSISQVKVYLFRARKKLQKTINQLNQAV
jgi:RNA polymerase sigma-70 factor (ECF subfamily)